MNFIFIDFLNSISTDHTGNRSDKDMLRDSRWLEKFINKWNFLPLGTLDDNSYLRLKNLRSLLCNMVIAIISEKAISNIDIDKLNESINIVSRKKYLIKDEDEYKLIEEPQQYNWKFVESIIALSFVDLLTKYDINRLKICGNPDCRWVFYDESKNNSRKWCGSTCRSLIKVRRYRKKQK